MKTLLKHLLLLIPLLIISSCESTDPELPILDTETSDHQIFTEEELTALIDALLIEGETDQSMPTARQSRSVNPVIDPINGFIVVGNSKLLRGGNSIAMGMKSNLVAGHAYTVWWVVWNFPENCTVPGACSDVDFAIAEEVGVDLLYAAGNVAGKKGIASFAGRLDEGDISGSINELIGLQPVGLLNAKKAEIHLAIRSHGPKIPGQVEDQIGSYEGGCTVYFDPFTEIPDAPGECGDIQFAIHQAN